MYNIQELVILARDNEGSAEDCTPTDIGQPVIISGTVSLFPKEGTENASLRILSLSIPSVLLTLPDYRGQ